MSASTETHSTQTRGKQTRTTQIFCASTLYGAATLAAALDAGLFGPADRRVLLITNNAANPEITPGSTRCPASTG